MAVNVDDILKRAIREAKNSGVSLNEIQLSLCYWFHKIDRLHEREDQ